jgi:hypothetical protein
MRSTLVALEQDVFRFLNALASVRQVSVRGESVRGKKRMQVCTYVDEDSVESRRRVRTTENMLKERHKNVVFAFSCLTLKDSHERPLGTN